MMASAMQHSVECRIPTVSTAAVTADSYTVSYPAPYGSSRTHVRLSVCP